MKKNSKGLFRFNINFFGTDPAQTSITLLTLGQLVIYFNLVNRRSLKFKFDNN